VECISGDIKKLHIIDESICIDCGVCGIYCPVECITDPSGSTVPKIKTSEIPKAKVDRDACSGCEFCIDICPFDCITLEDRNDHSEFFKVAVVDEPPCVSCRLCETVCMKDAIYVPRTTPYLETGTAWVVPEEPGCPK
jgi:ferredoxin